METLPDLIQSHPPRQTRAIHQTITTWAANHPKKQAIHIYEQATEHLWQNMHTALNAGDQQTADYYAETIVLLQEPAALTYAHRFHRIGKHRDDYRAAAHAGLWHAIATWDPAKGAFYQWAEKKVRHAVLKAVRDEEHQTISHHDFQRRGPVLKAQEGTPGASPAEIVSITSQRADSVTRIIKAARLESFDANPVEPAAPNSVEQEVEDRAEMLELHRLIDTLLTDQEREIIARQFGFGPFDPCSLYRIARDLKIPLREVQATYESAMAALRSGRADCSSP